MKEIGIIYCPTHKPFCSSLKRWKKMAAILDAKGVEYDMALSETSHSVERLFMKMIDQGYTTIVIAGGDSALYDAVNALMKVEKKVRDGITLGVIPNGIMNDFAQFWGMTYDDIELSVDSLVQHRTRKIDIGCIRYTDKSGEQKQRYFLNSVNIGLLARIQTFRQQTRRIFWSRKLSYLISLFMMVFQKMNYLLTYTINYTEETHQVTTLCVGNALGYGQTPNAVPYNGLLDVTVVRRSLFTQFIGAIYLFLRGKILMHKRVKPYRSQMVEIDSEKPLPLSIDGHPMESPVGKFTFTVEQETINFIIEKY